MSNNIETGTDVIEAKEYIRPAGFDAGKDWSYLLEKDYSNNHALFAQIMRHKLGKEALETASLEQIIYWFLAMHRWMQKSDANQAREGFRGRTMESVLKGSDTLAERVQQRLEEGESPEELLTKNRVHAGVDLEEPASAEEAEGTEEQEEAEAPAKVTKADLIAQAQEAGSELTEAQLKKLTVKKLEALLETLAS